MASSKKTSPKRRKSIAVTHQKKPVALPSRKRRAHSIVPGDRLSPKSKARRSLAPRKSILKASITLASEDDNNSSDNANTTAVFPDTRKSLGRRVSFAEHAHVRLFTKQNEQNTNSTASPQSSPVPAHDPAHVNDENAYPGSAAFRTRRSSARSSWGAESMDLENDNTAPNLSQFLRRDRGDDQDDSYDGEGEGDMEMTEALSNKINRKKSLSQSVRLPLTEVSTPKATSSHMVAAETSFVSSADEGESQQTQSSNTSLASNATDGDTETSLPIEYTIPTGRATAPASENPVWLALKNMTHSGGQDQEQSYEEEAAVSDEEALYPERQGDPELAEAQARLSAVRMALGLDDDEEDDDPANGVSREEQESFTSSSEDSGEIDAGDRTINLTGYLNRLRPSTISSGSAPMEETRMHQSATLEMQSRDSDSFTPEGPSPKGASMAAATEPPRLSVFSTPATKPVTPASASPSKQFDFSFTPKPSSASTPKVAIDKPTEKAAAPPPKPRPASPTKASGIPRPTAAFAAPVARVSPKKRAGAASGGGEAAAATPTKKRSASTREAESGSGAKPSPAKKVAVADRWNPNPSPVPVTAPTTSTTEAAGKGASSIKRLSPSKRAPFLAAQPQSQQNLEQGQEMPSLKNHLAKRKSLAVFPPAGAQTAVKALPKDKGKGRASVGSEPSNVWGGLIKEKDKENADGCEREKVRQSIALPSETRGSPRPASPRVAKVQDEHLQKENLALRLEATEQWRETLQDQSFTEETQPPVSIADFLTMTDIRFMDEITAPRRSLHPSATQQFTPARDASEIGLAECAVAMAVDLPQLELYAQVSDDLAAWIDRSKERYQQDEYEAAKVTPELFLEFMEADEAGKAELMHQLKLIKVNMHLQVKSGWYDWKLQWVEQLFETADDSSQALDKDHNLLKEIRTATAVKLPALREEHVQVMQDLEREQADVAEIENCDQEYLNELKTEITEQDSAVEALRAEVAEVRSQLKYLEEQAADMVAEKEQHAKAVQEAKRIIDVKKHTTKAEVARLKDELELLESLHMWRSTRVEPTLFEFIYHEFYRVSVPCTDYKPIPGRIDIRLWERSMLRFKDQWPQLSAYWLRVANERVARSGASSADKALTVPEIVQNLSGYWSSCTRLRSQLRLLAVKFPVTMTVLPSGGFKATAKVMCPQKKARAFVSFIFDEATFASWPLSIRNVGTDVEIDYGPVDRDMILKAINSKLEQSTPTHHDACLLSACVEAQEAYA